MSNKFWNENVKSNAIGGVIAGLIVAALLWFLRGEWWPVVHHGITSTWHGMTVAWAYLLGTTPVRRWAYGLHLLADVLLFLLLICLLVIAWKAKKEAQDSPKWLSYRSDNFFGLKWVWTYDGRAPRLTAVLCQKCDYQLRPDSTSMFDSRVRFQCDSCGRIVPVEGQSWDALQSVVIRLVQQKLRKRFSAEFGGEGQ
jgi:hypothetical protein